MSLLLTPISDKIALVLVGQKKSMADEETDVLKFSYDLTSDWKQTIRMFRLGLMLMLFFYSSAVRKYREEQNNFMDTKGLARMLDRFIRKSP